MFIKRLMKRIRNKKTEVLARKIENAKHEIEHLSNDDLQKMHVDYHNGVVCSESLGDKPSKLVKAIDDMVERELEKRGIKPLSDSEENIWFSQHRKI